MVLFCWCHHGFRENKLPDEFLLEIMLKDWKAPEWGLGAGAASTVSFYNLMHHSLLEAMF